ncbi:sugar ABC transporter substrate-binding protein, partial [Anabaena sp. UHCC 0187]|uniref:polysaccharide biosynthesis/export family protein n=1 Tax=Anabaena sp. UHCC 0187 TaxID=2590018 RepID=UPI0014466F27|nr:sugar ABC transporter substrate-binding protein [Anabaena sp. UHCC 0187]
RKFSFLCLITVQVTTAFHPALAQNLPPSQLLPSPPESTNVTPANTNNEISPQFSNYLLGIGDTISVAVQRPPGIYRLGIGDAISLNVQRFPDLSFQAAINPEGNIIVPLLGTVPLQGLTLSEAEAKIRFQLDRYIINPVTVLSLVGQRPDSSFQAPIGIDGNIIVPQVGKISVQGLNLEEAQTKIRLALSKVAPNQIVDVSLLAMRPVQLTITGEVFRPGIYSASATMPKITDILPLAGGSTAKADLRQVQIRRQLTDGSIISQKIDLYASLQNGTSPPNLRLQDGDAIIIPQREIGTDEGYDRNLIARSNLGIPQIKVRVLNYAAGGIATQSLPNGSTFIDALVGIRLDTANIRDIALVRFDPEQGKAITQKLDAKKALAGDAAQNVSLQDSDVIVIGRNLVGKVTNLLNTVTQPFFNVQSFLRFFQNFGSGLFGGTQQ